MLSTARPYLITSPHVATFPGLAIMLVVMGFNLFGDGLRDSLDPRLKELTRMGTLLRISNLHTHFYSAGKVIRAVDGITFEIREGEGQD